MKDTIQDNPSITETYQKWNGGDPILIIKLIKIKYFTLIDILKIITDKNNNLEPILWTMKYLIIDSEE